MISEAQSIVMVLQARYSSKRLPGKVLKTIMGKPMLELQIERLKKMRLCQKIVVATSTDRSDDPIAQLCERIDIDCFRGSLEDVLDRFYQAAKIYNPEHVIRMTGDCPLTDPELIDLIVERHFKVNADYTSNTLKPTYPDGLDTEVMKFEKLAYVWQNAKLPSEREHVTPFFYNNPRLFKLESFEDEVDRSNLRWVVDEEIDFNCISAVYENLYLKKPQFNSKDVLSFFESNPDIGNSNKHITRNEGYAKSLAKDKAFLEGNTNG